MTTWNQNLRTKMIALIKEAFGSCYTQYRFNKASNFVTFEQFQDEQAIDNLIALGEELKRMKEFKGKTDAELEAMTKVWYSDANHALVDSVSIEQANALYYKKQGIAASRELDRRQFEASAAKKEAV